MTSTTKSEAAQLLNNTTPAQNTETTTAQANASKDEKTRLADEHTTASDEMKLDELPNLDEATSADKQPQQPASPAGATAEKKHRVRDAVGGLVGGVLIGGVASTLLGMTIDPEAPLPDDDPNNTQTLSHPEWTDGDVPVATGVNDDMSFGEAFATARQEVGAGGVFEWHGNLYGTYTAEEWDALTPEQQVEYNNHFNWNHIDTTSGSDVAQTGGDDVEVVSVDQPDSVGSDAEAVSTDPAADPAAGSLDDSVQILGVVHDDTTGANIGMASIEDHDVILVDIDGDNVFDMAAVDVNQDGVISDDEVHVLDDQQLTVEQMGGISGHAENFFGVDAGDVNTVDTGIDPTIDPTIDGNA